MGISLSLFEGPSFMTQETAMPRSSMAEMPVLVLLVCISILLVGGLMLMLPVISQPRHVASNHVHAITVAHPAP